MQFDYRGHRFSFFSLRMLNNDVDRKNPRAVSFLVHTNCGALSWKLGTIPGFCTRDTKTLDSGRTITPLDFSRHLKCCSEISERNAEEDNPQQIQ